MIKKVFGDKLSRQLNYKHHVVAPLFNRAKTQFMEDYIKPTVKLSPKQIIIHRGTNNLPSSEDPEANTKNILNLNKNIKADTAKVTILGIIARRDTFHSFRIVVLTRHTGKVGPRTLRGDPGHRTKRWGPQMVP